MGVERGPDHYPGFGMGGVMVKKFDTKNEVRAFLRELPIGWEYKVIEVLDTGIYVFYREKVDD